ncbi:MAG TPA: DNA-processing protein DprA, partial [bacterium]|nr:DNA-processing protein DprA [bacterium]
ESFGSAEAVLEAPASRLRAVPGIASSLASAVAAWRESEYKKEFELIERWGLSVVSWRDPEYPPQLAEIFDPPVLLYVRGAFRPSDRWAVALVGSRRASSYGERTACRLARELAQRGVTVVSGLARGVDVQAHLGALAGGGRTIAVLGSGLGNIYPPEHRGLAKRIASAGAVISEFPVRAVPESGNFPRRNRVISGLSLGVVVVEAGSRSGALITARLAMEQGRSVMAVPGRVDASGAEGTTGLLRDGARLVATADDILGEFEYLEAKPAAAAAPAVELSPEEAAVLRALQEEDAGVEALMEKTGLTSPDISAILLNLELRRLVRRLPGRLYGRT